MKKEITRRNFLKTTTLVGLSTALGAKDIDDKPILWDEEIDVIVIGSGLAGCVASIYTSENGLKTLMLEQNSRVGGTSILSTLEMAIVNSPMQKSANIKDSPEKLAKDMTKAGKSLNHYNHSLNIAKNSAKALSYIISKGASYKETIKLDKGHSVARTVCPKGGGAKGVILPLHKHLSTIKNFNIQTKTKAQNIIKDDNGQVIGIEVLKKIGTTIKLYRYKANKGVIFATGGYSRDESFRTIQNPLVKHISSSTNKEAKADSLKYLIQAGATPVHLSLMRFAFSTPMNIMKYGCMLNQKTTKRFVNEDSSRQKLANAILVNMGESKTKKYPIIIFDTNGVNSFSDSSLLKKYFKINIIKKFSSLKQLSNYYNMNETKLNKELDKYNKFVKYGIDKAHGKKFSHDINDINIAPYYAMNIVPKLNYTQGGVMVDTSARVIDLINNNPIKGLYAAGESTGGIHGYSRLISCSSPDCLVYGLKAAEDILKQ